MSGTYILVFLLFSQLRMTQEPLAYPSTRRNVSIMYACSRSTDQVMDKLLILKRTFSIGIPIGHARFFTTCRDFMIIRRVFPTIIVPIAGPA